MEQLAELSYPHPGYTCLEKKGTQGQPHCSLRKAGANKQILAGANKTGAATSPGSTACI